MRTGVVTGLLRCAITCHWLVVSTPLKNISQLFTQGGRRSHSQHAVTQTTGIEETRLASESSRKEKKEWSADWIKKKLPVRQDMVSTHESNPKHAIGRKRHGNLPALYVAWSMDFSITFAFLRNFARHGRSVREFLGDDVEGFPNHSGIASWSQIFGLKSHSSVPSGKP